MAHFVYDAAAIFNLILEQPVRPATTAVEPSPITVPAQFSYALF
jgi:hypothetical protein